MTNQSNYPLPQPGAAPGQLPRSPHAPRPFKLCSVNALRAAIRACYDPVRDEHGVFYLVPKQPGLALLMEPELIAPELKRLVADAFNRDVSDQHVKDVLEILRTEYTNRMNVSSGRSWIGSGMGERCLLLDGNTMKLGYGQENMMLTKYWSPCWQPANCRPYVAQYAQGPSAWDVSQVQRLVDKKLLPPERELLLFTFMVLTMMSERAPLALEFTGESKSGTTTLIRTIKRLVDPCVSDELIRQHPGTVKDLDRLAWHHHALALDNVEAPLPEKVQRRMFDFLNGARLDWRPGRREPWPSFVMVRRTFLFSAHEPVVTQRELRERTLSLEMPPGEVASAYPGQPGWEAKAHAVISEYEAGLIQTALLALLGKAHAYIDHVRLGRHVPEGWEDFCRIGVIISQALHGSDQAFWAQYEAYRHERQREVIEEDPVAFAIMQYFLLNEVQGVSEKPAGVWLSELTPYRPAWATDRDWPLKPRGLGSAFKRAAPLLKDQGFICHSNGKRGSLCRWSIAPASLAARHY